MRVLVPHLAVHTTPRVHLFLAVSVSFTHSPCPAEAALATARDVCSSAIQQLKKFSDNNQTIGVAAKGKGASWPGTWGWG